MKKGKTNYYNSIIIFLRSGSQKYLYAVSQDCPTMEMPLPLHPCRVSALPFTAPHGCSPTVCPPPVPCSLGPAGCHCPVTRGREKKRKPEGQGDWRPKWQQQPGLWREQHLCSIQQTTNQTLVSCLQLEACKLDNPAVNESHIQESVVLELLQSLSFWHYVLVSSK